MDTKKDINLTIWKLPSLTWFVLTATAILLLLLFWDSLAYMVAVWETKEEYSHGYLIPVISLFLIWQKRDALQRLSLQGSWLGLLIVLFGLGMFLLGELSTLYVVVQYSFLLTLFGIVIALLGWKGFKIIWAALVFLIFMVPLPNFILNNLSNQLQLISSQLGVALIRACDISVYLEGNVIDLGTYKLQVAEACSGLNYLFPLMSLGFLCAYLFKDAFWKRVVLFLSSIPITILMNSFRVGIIGVLVEYWGSSMAEGFLHDFEGWVIFMACTALMLGEMWLLSRIGGRGRAFSELINLRYPPPTPPNAQVLFRRPPAAFFTLLPLLLVTVLGVSVIGPREEILPARKDFSSFPLVVNDWQGRGEPMEQQFIDTLKFDDYILANYDDGQQFLNFYVAYYASQRKGESAHSPRSCIPSGGWKIQEITNVMVDGVNVAGKPLTVNRLVIQKGDYKQLVYYWFQQRGRIITNEYRVKWYIFWDSLTRNRTDGGLVRLTTLIKPGEGMIEADARLTNFTQSVNEYLGSYIPD